MRSLFRLCPCATEEDFYAALSFEWKTGRTIFQEVQATGKSSTYGTLYATLRHLVEQEFAEYQDVKPDQDGRIREYRKTGKHYGSKDERAAREARESGLAGLSDLVPQV